jgi:hypothetical protein
MPRRLLPLKSLALGLLMTCAQIMIAVGFSNPEGSLADRYRTLVQHDSYWFANIIDRGYGTTVPPSDHKAMEISNVAFFPAYPLLAAGVKRLTHLSTYSALLVTAQAAAWGFWSYFFAFCERWGLSMALQTFGAVAIAAHPAAFYLVAAYSESLFLMMLVGFVYWSVREGRVAQVFAVLHGFTMSATRIVGLPCAAFPVVHSVCTRAWRGRPANTSALARYRGPVLIMLLSTLGAISFFAWCQARWSRWDIYMLTQQSGWAIRPDYLAIFSPRNYHWSLPPFSDSSRVSQFATALAAGLFALIALAELLAARFCRRTAWPKRLGIYFCAAVVYYISVAGVASVQMESMLRYDLCVHALVVLGALHFLREFRIAPVYVRALGMGVASVACAGGLSLQAYYIWNFSQGNWVA